MADVPDILSQDDQKMAALQQEWESYILRVKRDGQHARRRAVRFLLVKAFGTEHQYLFDPVFHAQVDFVEQMVDSVIRAEKQYEEAERHSLY